MPREEGWIGVDFDATLARSDNGEPIFPMVKKVRRWLDQGADVRIFTARMDMGKDSTQVAEVKEFCLRHFGRSLPVTNVKDKKMFVLYDDRARQVVRNTGEVVS